ncbi:MAG TPA: class III extradiol ring-cleavage dioxygenase [Holophagaceae bacterium]|nr:class III extradiol ring-cleavage dioxygenase [Holophagaceae bacterium]
MQPVLFISHGSPLRALDGGAWGEALKRLGARLAPKAILSVSAHWEAAEPLRLSSSAKPETLHDFGGFPAELYGIQYPAPGEPALAGRAAGLLRDSGFPAVLDPQRPLDHGTWSPLVHMVPDAKVPVVQLSLPRPRDPQALLRIGQALAPLRDEGVLILGSGGIVHNLRRLDWHGRGDQPEAWSLAFDAWAAEALARGNTEALLDWERRAPEPRTAHPTTEHWDPLFVALGAAGGSAVSTIYEGFEMGNLSLRSVIWG